MTEASFRTEPCTSYTKTSDADNKHYNIPLVMWFRSNVQAANYPASFTPDLGNRPFFRNTDDGSEYIFNRTNPFWPEEGNLGNGFGVRQPVLDSFSKEFNVEISGGIGHWLPASLARSISFYWQDVNGEDGAWMVRHLALVLRNWRTDEQKTWGSQLNNGDTTTGVKKIDSNFAYIKDPYLDSDWYVYGVIFNIFRNGAYGGSTPEANLADFRLGYEYKDLDPSQHRMVIGKEMSWQDFRTAMSKGEMQFEPPAPPPDPIAEWYWEGDKVDFDEVKMCDKPGRAIYWSTSNYLPHTDKNGVDISNVVSDAFNTKGLWYKHDDSPAISIPSSNPPSHNWGYCNYYQNTLNYTRLGPASSGGILRCYDYDPDG